MKVLFPLGLYYPSSIGGPANALYWHTKMLQNYGIDSVVITSDLGIEDKKIVRNKWQIKGTIKLIYCSGKSVLWKVLKLSIIEVNNCDIIHFSSICYAPNIFIALYAILKRKKIILSPRGELFPQAYKTKKYFLKTVLFSVYRLFQKQILFHATSTEEKECISKIFQKSKIVVQPNLIETTYSDAPQNRSDDIVFLGRINPIKSIDKLIRALPLSDLFMKSEGKLIIIGAARLPEEIVYKKRLEELIIGCKLDEKVVFVGTKTGHEKLELLNYSKVLVLPSESENFGNVVTEALSQSTPVVASIGTPWQILKDKKIGWWTSNTPENLAKVLDELYSLTEKEYNDYSLGARKYVEDYLDIKTSKYNNWSDIYSNLITSSCKS